MAIAATGSPELAEKIAAATAKEMRMTGINWVYSPVADVNTDSRNPVIGTLSNYEMECLLDSNAVGVRSFGDGAAATHIMLIKQN